MATLKVAAHTPVGIHRGVINASDASREDLLEFQENFQKGINNITYLVIFDGNTEIVLPSEVIKNSVIVFQIVD